MTSTLQWFRITVRLVELFLVQDHDRIYIPGAEEAEERAQGGIQEHELVGSGRWELCSGSCLHDTKKEVTSGSDHCQDSDVTLMVSHSQVFWIEKRFY